MSTHEIGVGLKAVHPRAVYEALGPALEEARIDVVSVFADLGTQPPIYPLLTMAPRTRRLRLGTACLNPFTLHPVEIAGQHAALDELSNGRAHLGIAAGAWLDRIGVDKPRPVRTLREAIEVVRYLLRRETNGYSGEIYSVEPGVAFEYEVRNPQPRLLIGSWGELTIALAGEQANELKVGGCANPRMMAVVRRRLEPGAARVGRSPDDVGVVFGAVTFVDDDRAWARAAARTAVAPYLDVVGALDPTMDVPADVLDGVRHSLASGDQHGAGAHIPDEVLDAFAFAGTPEEVAGHAVALFEAGVTRVEFGPPIAGELLDGVGMLRDRVVPAIRERLGVGSDAPLELRRQS